MSETASRLTRASAPTESHTAPSESRTDTACDSLLGTVKSTFDPFKQTFSSEGGAIHHVSEAVNALASVQSIPSQLLNTGIAQIPLLDKMPGMPAATIGVPHLGTPHAHAHPPSNGFPLPSVGLTIGSGCLSVLIGGIPAARVLDIGYAPTCGGLTPYFDIQTGSSNTFIGGMRAARMGIDMTRHCNPMGHIGKSGGKAASAAEKSEEVTGRANALGRAGKAWSVGNAALGPASGAATAADDTSQGEIGAAAMMAAQTAADLAFMMLGNLMGKDPGIEPSMGTLLLGNPTVLIGGFPLPDSQMMWHGAKHGIGKKIEPKLPKRLQELKCEFRGEPINPVTGDVRNDFTDYKTDEIVPFKWGRHYSSGLNRYSDKLGYGFRHTWQHELRLLRTRAVYTDPRGSEYAFPRRADGVYEGYCDGYEIEQVQDRRFILRHAAEGEIEFERTGSMGQSLRCVACVQGGQRSVLKWNIKKGIDNVTQMDANGRTRRIASFEYDQLGRITKVALTDVGGQVSCIARYEYDAKGCLVKSHSPLDAVSVLEYDHANRITRLIGPDGYAFFYRYDSTGHCIASAGQDDMWRVEFEYRPGRTIVTEGDGGKWTILYNDAGTITHVVDPYGCATEYVLGPYGYITDEIDSGGRTLRWLYDARDGNFGRLDRFGNLWPAKDQLPKLPNPLAHEVPNSMRCLIWGSVSDSDTAETVMLPYQINVCAQRIGSARMRHVLDERQSRDAAGRLLRRIGKGDYVERFEYDASGNLLRQFDRDGAVTSFTRCSWNLLASEQNSLGETIRYRYTSRRELASITDANNNETSYGYDFKNRITTVVRHGRLREQYVYDDGDRMIEKYDGAGNWLLKLAIGENGLPSTRTLSSGGKHIYEYDHFGHHTKASTEAHEITRTFDGQGRRTSDKRDGLGVEHHYDGNRLRRTIYFNRFEVSYTSAANGETSIGTPVGGVHSLQRGRDGRVLMLLGNGTHACYTFDDLGRCTGRIMWRTDHSSMIHQVEYEYSGTGELQRVTDSAKGDTQYQYDGAHRLIGEVQDGWQTRRYTYDAAGNLLSTPTCSWLRHTSGNRLSTTSRGQFRYNERNHLCEAIVGNGRRTLYHYDSMDLLVRIEWSDRNEVWTAKYDGLCRQTRAGTGDRQTEYYWDEDRLAAQLESNGNLRIFVYAHTESLVPFLFIDYPDIDASPESGRVYYVFCNQVGMPERIEDASGAPAWLAKDIDPYGTIHVAEENSVDYDLRWPGHLLHRDSGLHYNRFRSYSPSLGRYLQSDPIGLAGGINLYAYPSNPVGTVDVLGLTALHDANEESAHHAPDETTAAGPMREQSKREQARLAKEAEYEAAISKLKQRLDALNAKRGKLLEKNDWLESGNDINLNRQIKLITDERDNVKESIDKFPRLRSRETEFRGDYSQETHLEMIKRYTVEGKKWAREGDISGLPVDPNKNPAGLVAQRDQLNWVDGNGTRIPYYKKEPDGSYALDANGNKITNLTYDHHVSAAQMYNKGATIERRNPFPDGPVTETKRYPPGCNTDRATRDAFHDDPDNLVAMGRSANSAKGSAYDYDVPTGDKYKP